MCVEGCVLQYWGMYYAAVLRQLYLSLVLLLVVVAGDDGGAGMVLVLLVMGFQHLFSCNRSIFFFYDIDDGVIISLCDGQGFWLGLSFSVSGVAHSWMMSVRPDVDHRLALTKASPAMFFTVLESGVARVNIWVISQVTSGQRRVPCEQ